MKNDLYAKHYSTPFNPRIAQVFFKAGFTESWGRGFTKIQEACEKYECPLPELYMDKGGTMILCNASERYKKLLNNISSQNVGLNVGLNEIQQKIIDLILNNKNIKQSEIANELNISSRTVERNINYLKEKNIIKRIGSKKVGYWEVIK